MENVQDGLDSALKVSEIQFSHQCYIFSVLRRGGGRGGRGNCIGDV